MASRGVCSALLSSHFLPLIPSSPQPFLSRSFILQSFLQSVVLSLSANTKKKKKKGFFDLDEKYHEVKEKCEGELSASSKTKILVP